MKFTEVKELPGKKYVPKFAMRDALNEFMKMNIKAAKLENHGYKNSRNAYTAFYKAAKKWAFPVDVCMRNGEVYLIRRDM